MKEHEKAVEVESRTATCRKHGNYNSYNYIGTIWSRCGKCANESEQRRLADNLARMVVEAGIPPRFSRKTFDNYNAETEEHKKALAVCIDYARNFDTASKLGQCFVFCGNKGTGKTHLSVAIAKHVMKHNGCSTLYTTAMRAIRRVRSTWNNRFGEREDDVIKMFCSRGLLIIDEVGVQFESKTEENVLFDIINGRYEHRRPTIVVSNLDKKGVERCLGERSFDRLREGGGKLVPFTWGSYRGSI